MRAPDGFIEDFPVMLNRDLAEKYGLTFAQVKHLARRNKLYKCANFHELTKERVSNILSAVMQINGIRNGFKKGNHVKTEFKKGHRMSEEICRKKSETMKEIWRKERLRQTYGLERKTKLRVK